MEDYESVLLVKSEVFVFKIPPRTSNRGVRASDWNLATPDWTGRMRLVTKGKDCVIKLEDKISGELFAKCPIDQYPGIALEAVSDSSRYFVLRIQDDSGRAAFIGIGFSDRSDSFDLNVALQDHFKWLNKTKEFEKEGEPGEASKPKLDLSFKDGQTIKINMKIGKRDNADGPASARPKAKVGGLAGLPPPPGGVRIAPPGTSPSASGSKSVGGDNLLIGIDANQSPQQSQDVWGDFTSAGPQGLSAAPAAPPASK
nr:EOG090X0G5X [Sida crystallina]